MVKYNDEAAKAIALLMRMANIIDEKPSAIDVGISSNELGMGYRAWSIKLREIIRLINDLQAEKYELLEQINILSSISKNSLDLDELPEECRIEIWEHYNRLMQENSFDL